VRKSPYGRRSAKSVSAIRSSASTLQRAIFTETLRDAPILAARFVAALARCPASPGARLLPDRAKIGGVAAVTTM